MEVDILNKMGPEGVLAVAVIAYVLNFVKDFTKRRASVSEKANQDELKRLSHTVSEMSKDIAEVKAQVEYMRDDLRALRVKA